MDCTGSLTAKKAQDVKIGNENQKLEFPHTFSWFKKCRFSSEQVYMPFGPPEMVIPYLVMRKAEENMGLPSASGLNRELSR